MSFNDVIYLDALLELLDETDKGALILTNKQVKRCLYIKLTNPFESVILYRLFYEFDNKIISEINKLSNPIKILNEVSRKTNTNIDDLDTPMMEKCIVTINESLIKSSTLLLAEIGKTYNFMKYPLNNNMLIEDDNNFIIKITNNISISMILNKLTSDIYFLMEYYNKKKYYDKLGVNKELNRLNIHAMNFNAFRIMSGMAGLAYSN